MAKRHVLELAQNLPVDTEEEQSTDAQRPHATLDAMSAELDALTQRLDKGSAFLDATSEASPLYAAALAKWVGLEEQYRALHEEYDALCGESDRGCIVCHAEERGTGHARLCVKHKYVVYEAGKPGHVVNVDGTEYDLPA